MKNQYNFDVAIQDLLSSIRKAGAYDTKFAGKAGSKHSMFKISGQHQVQMNQQSTRFNVFFTVVNI